MILTLVLTAMSSAAPGRNLAAAIESKISVPAASVKIVNWKAPNCHGEFEVGPIQGSGRVAVRVRGPKCDAWTWATISVVAPRVVAQRDIASGTEVTSSLALQSGEIRHLADVVTSIPQGAVATRNIQQGTAIRPEMLRYGPKPGSPLLVRIQKSGLMIENQGTAVGCSNGNVCATLPNGRRVEGQLENGILVVTLGDASARQGAIR